MADMRLSIHIVDWGTDFSIDSLIHNVCLHGSVSPSTNLTERDKQRIPLFTGSEHRRIDKSITCIRDWEMWKKKI